MNNKQTTQIVTVRALPRYLRNRFIQRDRPQGQATRVSSHCHCPATTHLIFTIESGSLPIKNS